MNEDIYADISDEELEEIFNDLVADDVLMCWEAEHEYMD